LERECRNHPLQYFKVDFLESPDQQFGFDKIQYNSSDATTQNIYLLLANNPDPTGHPKNSNTRVRVVVQDLSQSVFVKSSDQSVFKIQGAGNRIDLSANVTEITFIIYQPKNI
jgi:hypothetical protein